jgi:hypothetical protein
VLPSRYITLAIFACWGRGLSRAFQQVIINTIASNTTCRDLSTQCYQSWMETTPGVHRITKFTFFVNMQVCRIGLKTITATHHKPVSAPTLNSRDSRINALTTYAVHTTDVTCVNTKRIKVESTSRVLRSQRTHRRRRTRTIYIRTETGSSMVKWSSQLLVPIDSMPSTTPIPNHVWQLYRTSVLWSPRLSA